MGESFVQFIVNVAVQMSPEEFLKKYNTVLIREIELNIGNIKGETIALQAESFDISEIEEA